MWMHASVLQIVVEDDFGTECARKCSSLAVNTLFVYEVDTHRFAIVEMINQLVSFTECL